MALERLTSENYTLPRGPKFNVYDRWYNILVDAFNTVIPSLGIAKANTVSEYTAGSGVTVDGVLLKDGGICQTSNVTEYTTTVTLTAAEIVGNSAGDIGHASGAVLVASPGIDYALEFVSAVLIYDFAGGAYTGGAEDLVIRVFTVPVSSVIATANCLKAAGDKVYRVGAIATEKSLGVGSTINLFGTAYTQPGGAAGVLRIHLTYRKHTTNL